jgi:hypothetical protein
VSQLVETIAAELERPRELSARVLNYITGHHGIDEDAIGPFLVQELPKLEDYEIDLILSPVFTPKLIDQAVFADQLGVEALRKDQWPALVQELVERPTYAQLVTIDGKRHSVKLREVTIERYVYRLRLDATIPKSLFALLDAIPVAGDKPLAKAVARQVVWENEGTREILEGYLTAALGRGIYSLDENVALLNLIEGRKPANIADLLARSPGWQEALRQQIDVASGPKPFFNEDIRLLHGEERDQRSQDDVRMSSKERELHFLARLQDLFNKSYT